jgi:hypothetical protein
MVRVIRPGGVLALSIGRARMRASPPFVTNACPAEPISGRRRPSTPIFKR